MRTVKLRIAPFLKNNMIKKIFITGLAATIPLVITMYVVYGLFHFDDLILGKYINEVF